MRRPGQQDEASLAERRKGKEPAWRETVRRSRGEGDDAPERDDAPKRDNSLATRREERLGTDRPLAREMACSRPGARYDVAPVCERWLVRARMQDKMRLSFAVVGRDPRPHRCGDGRTTLPV